MLARPPKASPLVARDERATYVAAYLRSGEDQGEAGERIMRELADIGGVTVGGYAVAVPQVSDQVSEDLARAEMLAFPLLFLLSLLVFRGAVAALLPLFVGLLTIMGTFLGLRLVNEGLLLSIFALNLTIGLGLGLAIDYSLFVLSRYREEIERVGAGRDALVRTLKTAGRTVIFSSLTVAVAMLSLLVFPARFLYSMGIAGAITAVVAGTVALTALPALLVLLGDRVNALAPARLHHREVVTERGFFYRLSLLIMRRPVIVALVTATVLVLAGLPFLRIEFAGVDASVLPAELEREGRRHGAANGLPAGPDVAAAGRGHGAALERRRGPRLARRSAGSRARRGRPTGLRRRADVAHPGDARDARAQAGGARPRRARARGARARPVAVAGESARFVDQVSSLGGRLPLALAMLAVTTLLILFAMTAPSCCR